MGAKYFGARVTRLEDPALLAGRGRFVDDVKPDGLLHACFVRSPHAHAKLRGCDARAALTIPGVHAVLTADDLPEPMRSATLPLLLPHPALAAPRTQTVLAREEVSYVGQAVALVIADTRYIAEDAAAALIVQYDALPAVSDCRAAAEDGAACVHGDLQSNIAATFGLAYGDINSAFANAAHVFNEALWQHRGGGMAIETRAVLAHHDAVVRSPHRVVRHANAAYRPAHARRSARPRPAVDPHDRAQRRRRLRPEGDLLSGRGGDPGGGAQTRPAGEMDRGPARAFSVRDPGARPILGRRDRGRRQRKNSWHSRPHAARQRRVRARGASSCPTSPPRQCPAPM